MTLLASISTSAAPEVTSGSTKRPSEVVVTGVLVPLTLIVTPLIGWRLVSSINPLIEVRMAIGFVLMPSPCEVRTLTIPLSAP